MNRKPMVAGQEDRSGELVGKHIRLVSISRTRPRLLYLAKCEKCNSTWTGHQDDDPKCRNKGCTGEAEADISHLPWREQHKIEQEREQAAELAKVEATYKKLSNEVRQTEREALLVWPDHEFVHSPETRNQGLTSELPTIEANNEYSRIEAEAFVAETPGYFPCENNWKNLVAYLQQQGTTHRVSREDLDRAYRRLLPLGLIETRPKEPEPESPSKPVAGSVKGYALGTKNRSVQMFTPEQVAKMNAAEYKAAIVAYDQEVRKQEESQTSTKSRPGTMPGIDLETGLPKDYTQRQIDAMSAEEYRRVFIHTQEGLRDADLVLAKRYW